MRPLLPVLLSVPTGVALATLDRHPMIHGAPTESLGFAAALALGATGCAFWFRGLWSELPTRKGLPEDAAAEDWWRPSVVWWVWKALSVLPEQYVPSEGEGPTRQLPTDSFELRIVAKGSMVLHVLVVLALYCLVLWFADLLRWAVA